MAYKWAHVSSITRWPWEIFHSLVFCVFTHILNVRIEYLFSDILHGLVTLSSIFTIPNPLYFKRNCLISWSNTLLSTFWEQLQICQLHIMLRVIYLIPYHWYTYSYRLRWSKYKMFALEQRENMDAWETNGKNSLRENRSKETKGE